MRTIVVIGVVCGFVFTVMTHFAGYPNGPIISPTLIALAAIMYLLGEKQ
jgi:hypothetical protein